MDICVFVYLNILVPVAPVPFSGSLTGAPRPRHSVPDRELTLAAALGSGLRDRDDQEDGGQTMGVT